MAVCQSGRNMNEYLYPLCVLCWVFKVISRNIRAVVVEHARTCICQSGYILDHPCDNFQDIYCDK